MGLLDQLGGMLQQYIHTQPTQAPASVEQDYDHVARSAPQGTVAGAIAEALRSNHTPAFGQSVAELFGRADSSQRAGVLNALIAAAGPGILQSVLGNASGLGGLLARNNHQITPEMAQQVSPDVVAQVAQEAERKDPSIVDKVSQVYAEHPHLVKALGTAAMMVALTKIAKDQHVGPY